MPTPDDPRSRRSLALLSHGKPRPYRRQMYSDEPYRLSRPHVILLVLGAALVAVLILAVAVVAQEHANATRGKEIIAAAHVDTATSAPLPQLAVTPPVLDDSSLPIPGPLTPPAPRQAAPAVSEAAPVRKPLAPQPVKRPAPVSETVQPVSDPDVDLIATILSLTPPAPPTGIAVCTASQPANTECTP